MTKNMQRRRVLAGLAAGGVSFLAGCSGGNGGGGNNTTQANDGGNGGGGGEASPTSTESTTAAATTMATTAQQTATQMATSTPASTANAEPATTESTSVPMTTGSSPSTAAPTGMATTGPGTATGLMDVDFSNLTTYTGDSFSIKYPAGWSVSSETSSGVMFQSSSGFAQMFVKSITVPSSATSEQLVSKFLQGYRQGASGSDTSVEIQKKRTVTLPNGNSAKLVETQIGSGSVAVHQDILLTVVNGTAYVVAITVPESAYTSSTAQQIEKILLSLTIKQ